MKKLIVIFIAGLIILGFGYLFKEKNIIFNIYDFYYILSYLTLSMYIIYGIIIVTIIFYIKNKKQRMKNK
jgi:K+-sensing histidine kinase KdpD